MKINSKLEKGLKTRKKEERKNGFSSDDYANLFF